MAAYFAALICGVLFLVIPIVNHIRMLFAIRRHNSRLGNTVAAHQMSVVLRREKRVALNMCGVAIILLASLMPVLSMKILELKYPRMHAIALPWSVTVAFLTSSINPVFYLMGNPNLRNAVKALIKS